MADNPNRGHWSPRREGGGPDWRIRGLEEGVRHLTHKVYDLVEQNKKMREDIKKLRAQLETLKGEQTNIRYTATGKTEKIKFYGI